MVDLVRHPMRKSLFRDSTVFGAERVPGMIVLLFAGALAFAGMQWWSVLAGLFFAIGGMWLLRRAYRMHPQMTRVYVHWSRLASYYPARRRVPPPLDHRELPFGGRR